ncbi:MAG: haloacid dehalogenase-like hydrolase [Magnetococcus sp. DMHC-6]
MRSSHFSGGTQTLTTPHAPIALLDWDGTMRRGYTMESWLAFLEQQSRAATGTHALFRQLYNNHKQGNLGYDAFLDSAAQLYAQQLQGSSQKEILALANHYWEQDRPHLFDFASKLLDHLSHCGFQIILISGAPAEVLNLYAQGEYFSKDQRPVWFMEIVALEMEIDNGIFTGRIAANPGTLHGKREAVAQVLANKSGDVIRLGAGNSNSDQPLLDSARLALIVDNTTLTHQNALRLHTDHVDFAKLEKFFTLLKPQ